MKTTFDKLEIGDYFKLAGGWVISHWNTKSFRFVKSGDDSAIGSGPVPSRYVGHPPSFMCVEKTGQDNGSNAEDMAIKWGSLATFLRLDGRTIYFKRGVNNLE